MLVISPLNIPCKICNTFYGLKKKKKNKCFAAWVEVALKYLVYWGNISLLIDNVAVGLVPR